MASIVPSSPKWADQYLDLKDIFIDGFEYIACHEILQWSAILRGKMLIREKSRRWRFDLMSTAERQRRWHCQGFQGLL